jgi:hypothetical protein
VLPLTGITPSSASHSLTHLHTPAPDEVTSQSVPLNALPALLELPTSPVSANMVAAPQAEPETEHHPGSPLGAASPCMTNRKNSSSWSFDLPTHPKSASYELPDCDSSTLSLCNSTSRGRDGRNMAAAAAAAISALEGGHDVAVPTPTATSLGAERPAALTLVKLGLPSAAVAVAVCPVLVPTGTVLVARRGSRPPATTDTTPFSLLTEGAVIVPPMAGKADEAQARAEPGAVVSLIAVGTLTGTVEVVSTTKGVCQPLAMTVVESFKVRSIHERCIGCGSAHLECSYRWVHLHQVQQCRIPYCMIQYFC